MQRFPTAAKILMVDDNSSDVRLFQEMFSDYHVFNDFIWVKDGEEALRVIREERPDLVLLETILPVRDGFEVLEEIKADEDLRGTKVIMVTDSDNLGYVRRRASTAYGFLSKPITLEDLVRVVSQIDGLYIGLIKLTPE